MLTSSTAKKNPSFLALLKLCFFLFAQQQRQRGGCAESTTYLEESSLPHPQGYRLIQRVKVQPEIAFLTPCQCAIVKLQWCLFGFRIQREIVLPFFKRCFALWKKETVLRKCENQWLKRRKGRNIEECIFCGKKKRKEKKKGSGFYSLSSRFLSFTSCLLLSGLPPSAQKRRVTISDSAEQKDKITSCVSSLFVDNGHIYPFIIQIDKISNSYISLHGSWLNTAIVKLTLNRCFYTSLKKHNASLSDIFLSSTLFTIIGQPLSLHFGAFFRKVAFPVDK